MNEQYDELVTILSLATDSAPADVVELLYGEHHQTAADRSSVFV